MNSSGKQKSIDADFFNDFNENCGVPPEEFSNLVLDPEFNAGEGRVAIDHASSFIGHDLFPFINGVELSGQPD